MRTVKLGEGLELEALDLEGFSAYLDKRGLGKKRQRPYLVRWVKRFLLGAGTRVDLEAADRKRLFEEKLRGDGRFQEWQVKQAWRQWTSISITMFPGSNHGKERAPLTPPEAGRMRLTSGLVGPRTGSRPWNVQGKSSASGTTHIGPSVPTSSGWRGFIAFVSTEGSTLAALTV